MSLGSLKRQLGLRMEEACDQEPRVTRTDLRAGNKQEKHGHPHRMHRTPTLSAFSWNPSPMYLHKCLPVGALNPSSSAFQS